MSEEFFFELSPGKVQTFIYRGEEEQGMIKVSSQDQEIISILYQFGNEGRWELYRFSGMVWAPLLKNAEVSVMNRNIVSIAEVSGKGIVLKEQSRDGWIVRPGESGHFAYRGHNRGSFEVTITNKGTAEASYSHDLWAPPGLTVYGSVPAGQTSSLRVNWRDYRGVFTNTGGESSIEIGGKDIYPY